MRGRCVLGSGWGGPATWGKHWLVPHCCFGLFTRGVPGLASSAPCSRPIVLRPGNLRIFLAGKGRMSQDGGSPLPPAEGVGFTLWVATPKKPMAAVRRGSFRRVTKWGAHVSFLR